LSDIEQTDRSNVGIIRPRRNDAPSKVKIIIYHRFPGIELVSPVYAGTGIECYLSPDQRVDVGFFTQASFNLTQGWSTGVLIYKLQKKNIDEFNETTCIQLVIKWKVDRFEPFYIKSFLIEHDKGCVWDRATLMKLAKHDKLTDIQHHLIEKTWLMHDNTVLMTRENATCEEECYKLEMTISETSIRNDTRRLRYFDVNR
jgi:hypothetical protein